MRRYISSGCTFVLYKYLVTQYDNVNDFIITSEGLSAPPVLRKAAAIPREVDGHWQIFPTTTDTSRSFSVEVSL